MSLAGRRREPNPSARADDLQTPAMKTRWIRVIIGHHSDSLDGNTLGAELTLSSGLWV
jgi:hypothetical protein